MHNVTSSPSSLGPLIRQARREAGFSNIETFAVSLGVGFSTVQRWEKGRGEPSVARLRQIAEKTGKPVSFFLTGAVA